MGNLSQNEIIQMMGNFNNNDWAHNSRFYQAVMCDGNIFNPYIHRRWLPAQFKKLMDAIIREKRLNGLSAKLEKEDVIDYFGRHPEMMEKLLQTTLKEINLLSFLRTRDLLAFTERSQIYSFDRCQKIVLAHVKLITKWVSIYDTIAIFWFSFHNRWLRGDTDAILDYLKKLEERITTAKDYASLNQILKEYYSAPSSLTFYKLSEVALERQNLHLRKEFLTSNSDVYEAFMLAGAYYSLKSYYMFDNQGKSAVKCQIIQNELESGKGWDYFLREYCQIRNIKINL